MAYDTWTFGFAEHLDPKNGGYLIGKFVSSAFLFAAFVEFLTEE